AQPAAPVADRRAPRYEPSAQGAPDRGHAGGQRADRARAGGRFALCRPRQVPLARARIASPAPPVPTPLLPQRARDGQPAMDAPRPPSTPPGNLERPVAGRRRHRAGRTAPPGSEPHQLPFALALLVVLQLRRTGDALAVRRPLLALHVLLALVLARGRGVRALRGLRHVGHALAERRAGRARHMLLALTPAVLALGLRLGGQ